MEYKDYIKSKKFYLKGLAQQIRQLKAEFKELEKSGEPSYHKRREIQKAKYEFRHEHIAYFFARKVPDAFGGGKNRSKEAAERYLEVERTVHEGNEPNWDYIRELYETYPVIPQVDHEASICVDSE